MFYNYKNMQVPEFDIREPMKRAVPYTVIPIGNKEDLLQWRKDQALLAEARDAYLKPIRQATRDRVVAMVANQNADTALSEREQAEVKCRESWIRKAPKRIEAPIYVSLESPPSKSLLEVIRDSVKSLWDSTGFYK